MNSSAPGRPNSTKNLHSINTAVELTFSAESVYIHYNGFMFSIEFVENYFPLYCRELMESNIFHKFRAMQFSTEFVGNNFPLEYRLQLVDEFTLYVLRVLSKDMISSHPIRVEATFRKLSFFINLVSSVYDGCAIK